MKKPRTPTATLLTLLPCNQCEKSFLNSSKLRSHVKDHHTLSVKLSVQGHPMTLQRGVDKNFKCPVCKYTTSLTSEISKHIKALHAISPVSSSFIRTLTPKVSQNQEDLQHADLRKRKLTENDAPQRKTHREPLQALLQACNRTNASEREKVLATYFAEELDLVPVALDHGGSPEMSALVPRGCVEMISKLPSVRVIPLGKVQPELTWRSVPKPIRSVPDDLAKLIKKSPYKRALKRRTSPTS